MSLISIGDAENVHTWVRSHGTLPGLRRRSPVVFTRGFPASQGSTSHRRVLRGAKSDCPVSECQFPALLGRQVERMNCELA